MTVMFEQPDLPPILTRYTPPGPGITDLSPGDAIQKLGDRFSANMQASEYDAVSFGRRNAMIDATQNRINQIKKATGEDIENPYNITLPDQSYQFTDAPRPQDPFDVFQSKLNDLKNKYPDKASIIGADRPISQDAIDLANQSQQTANKADNAVTGLIPWIAGFLGGVAGSFRDPIQVGALAVPIPGAGAAASILGKVAVAGIQQAAINAGLSVLSQPAVQSWRAERGQESGILPSIKEVGEAALFGAIPGAGGEVLKLTGQKALRTLFNRASNGDSDAALEIAKQLPKDIAPETSAAVEANDLNAVAKSAEPQNADPIYLDQSYNEAVRHAEDPNEPLPTIPPIEQNQPAVIDRQTLLAEHKDSDGFYNMATASDAVEKQVGQALANGQKVTLFVEGKSREIKAVSKLGLVDENGNPWGVGGALMFPKPGENNRIEISNQPPQVTIREARSLMQAVDALRAQPQSISSAIASQDLELSKIGRIASLGNNAYGMVKSGEISPIIASEVAARVPDESSQVAIMREVAKDNPQTPREAAQLTSQAMERQSLPEAQYALLGADGSVERSLPNIEEDRGELAQRSRQMEELEKKYVPELPENKTGTENFDSEKNAELQEDLTGPIVMPPLYRGTKPKSLVKFFQNAKGIRDSNGDLKAAGLNRFPGLISKTGMPLNDVMRNAIENGYLGADFDRLIHEKTEADLIEKLVNHPVYSINDLDKVIQIEENKRLRDEAEKLQNHRNEIIETLTKENSGFTKQDLIPEALNAAARLMHRENIEPDIAYERAVMYHLAQDLELRDLDVNQEIPWDDFAAIDARRQHEGASAIGSSNGEHESAAGKEDGIRQGSESAPGNRGNQTNETKYEPGAEGKFQQLIPGIDPISNRERAELAATKPLRGGGAPLPEGGLFDQAARQQIDWLDTVPASARSDGKDTVPMTREDLIAREPREGFLARLVAGCKEI